MTTSGRLSEALLAHTAADWPEFAELRAAASAAGRKSRARPPGNPRIFANLKAHPDATEVDDAIPDGHIHAGERPVHDPMGGATAFGPGLEPARLVVHAVAREVSLAKDAREHAIGMSGRGSVVDSAVAYVLGPSEIDATEWDPHFDRFLPEAASKRPDTATHFDPAKRDQGRGFKGPPYGVPPGGGTGAGSPSAIRMTVA